MIDKYGWNYLSDGETKVLFVPGGLVIATSDVQENGQGIGVAIGTVFVPCGEHVAATWIVERAEARVEAKT